MLIMLMVPSNLAKAASASMINNSEKNTWSVVLPLKIQVAGEGASIAVPVQLVIAGAAQV